MLRPRHCPLYVLATVLQPLPCPCTTLHPTPVQLMAHTFSLPGEEKIKARTELLAGKMKDMLMYLQKLLVSAPPLCALNRG